jgi:hypothetical protein
MSIDRYLAEIEAENSTVQDETSPRWQFLPTAFAIAERELSGGPPRVLFGRTMPSRGRLACDYYVFIEPHNLGLDDQRTMLASVFRMEPSLCLQINIGTMMVYEHNGVMRVRGDLTDRLTDECDGDEAALGAVIARKIARIIHQGEARKGG